MKKRIIIIVLIVSCILPFAWSISLIKCEILTFLYGDEFREGYKVTNMLDEIDYLKVLSHSSTKARIYYVGIDRSSGNVIRFVKDSAKWEMDGWDTVWAMTGNADSFLWPYLYDSYEGLLLMLTIGVPLLIMIIILLVSCKKQWSLKS